MGLGNWNEGKVFDDFRNEGWLRDSSLALTTYVCGGGGWGLLMYVMYNMM